MTSRTSYRNVDLNVLMDTLYAIRSINKYNPHDLHFTYDGRTANLSSEIIEEQIQSGKTNIQIAEYLFELIEDNAGVPAMDFVKFEY